jgi:transcriptional antiterminator NusG
MTSAVCRSSPKWFAVYTASRHEKRVSLHLTDRDVESFLPVHRTVHHWKNRTKAALELPLFPSYVFVRIAADMTSKVLSVPGVLSLVGSKREPWALPDQEMETLRSGLDHCKPEPHPYLVVGDRARIRTGPLAGMEGVLVQKKNGVRVVLTVDHIMRSVSVEIEIQHLEAMPAHSARAS